MPRLAMYMCVLLGLLLGCSPAAAQVSIRTRLFGLDVGPGVHLRSPFFNLDVMPAPPRFYPGGPGMPPPFLPAQPGQLPLVPGAAVPGAAVPGLAAPTPSPQVLPQPGPLTTPSSRPGSLSLPAPPGEQPQPQPAPLTTPSVRPGSLPLPAPPGEQLLPKSPQPRTVPRFNAEELDPEGDVSLVTPTARTVPPQKISSPGPLAAPAPAVSAVVPAQQAVLPGLMTHYDFARTFVPAPGSYQVDLIHPRSGRPVHVSFNLPPGRPRLRVGPSYVAFDYGQHEVEIRFRLFGRVTVDYDD